MAKEYACIVKRSAWFSDAFESWCGRKFETSRAAGWLTPTCPACEQAKKRGK